MSDKTCVGRSGRTASRIWWLVVGAIGPIGTADEVKDLVRIANSFGWSSILYHALSVTNSFSLIHLLFQGRES